MSRSWTKEEVEKALKRPWHAFALPHGLEEAFDAATGDVRRRTLRWQLALLLTLSVGALPTSARAGLLSFDLTLRLFFMLPAFVIGITVLSRRCSSTVQSYASSLPILVSLTIMITLSFYADDATYDRYIVGVGNVMVVMNIIMPRCPRGTVIFAAVNQVVLFVGILGSRSSGAPIVDVAAVFTIFNALTLVACFRSERGAREVFLYQLRHSLQTEELTASNAELKHLSQMDALTGIANRRSFDAALERTFSAPSTLPRSTGLLMVDVDFFKSFNDTAGHLAGDGCLQAIAETLAAEVQSEYHFSARYGGEQFVILVENADVAQIDALAKRVLSAVKRRAIPHPGLVSAACVTISIGSALVAAAPNVAADLITAADCALYEAKRLGRNRTVMYDSSNLARQAAE